MPPEKRPSGGVREPTELPPELWPQAGAWLAAAIERSGLSKRQVLSRIGYEGGTNRLNSYLAGERLPIPRTLRAICAAIGASYLEAVQRFGYYHELIRILDDLVLMAERWLEEDDAYGGAMRTPLTSRVETLRGTGVLHWKGQPITPGRRIPIPFKDGALTCDPLEDPRFATRYIIAWWYEPEHEAIKVPLVELKGPGSTSKAETTPPVGSLIYVEPARSVPTIVPKPLALAIILAVLSFPRRGDLLRDESVDYLDQLYAASGVVVQEAYDFGAAQSRAARRRHQDLMLRRVLESLDDRALFFDARRVIAAEYAVMWADRLCQPFTHHARLAAFERWGEAGSRVSTATAFSSLPGYREASLPPIDRLTMYS